MTSSAAQAALRNGVSLRFLCPRDKNEVKRLCNEWFPIQYPDSWYDEITSNKRFFSLAAIYQRGIIGLIICEVKSRSKCHKEDADLLSTNFPSLTEIGYILSLGVTKDYRENGVGSLLLDSLLSEVVGNDKYNVRALYLHVLATNYTAIRFYENRNFRQHKHLPSYYNISGDQQDGFCYVLYVNGGQPPWSVTDYVRQVSNMFSRIQPCNIPTSMMRHTRNVTRSVLLKIPKILPRRLQPAFFGPGPPPAGDEPEPTTAPPILEREDFDAPSTTPPCCDAENCACVDETEAGATRARVHVEPPSATTTTEDRLHDDEISVCSSDAGPPTSTANMLLMNLNCFSNGNKSRHSAKTTVTSISAPSSSSLPTNG